MKPLEAIVHNLSRPMEPLPTDTAARLDKLSDVKAVLFDVYGTLFVSGSGDVGTAAATDTAEALTQALEAAHYRGDLERAGERGKNLLKAEVLEWHAASRAAGIDFPEVDISRIWKKVVGRLRKDGILTPRDSILNPFASSHWNTSVW